MNPSGLTIISYYENNSHYSVTINSRQDVSIYRLASTSPPHFRFNDLGRQKQVALLGIVAGLLLLVIIIVAVASCAPSGWTNDARIVDGGKFIETHTVCGPVQG